MKRIAGFLLILLLALLGCAAPEQPVEDPTAVLAPEPCDVTLTLPLRRNGETSTALKAFTAGFADPKGMPMTFRATSADTDVAICALSDDGTLFISAAGIGETVLTVTGFASDGRSADTTVGVNVTDARRTVALIVLGVLVVALLILFGRPVRKEPQNPVAAIEEEPQQPVVVIEEEPADSAPEGTETQSERSSL